MLAERMLLSLTFKINIDFGTSLRALATSGCCQFLIPAKIFQHIVDETIRSN